MDSALTTTEGNPDQNVSTEDVSKEEPSQPAGEDNLKDPAEPTADTEKGSVKSSDKDVAHDSNKQTSTGQEEEGEMHHQLKFNYEAELMVNGIYEDTDITIDPAIIQSLTDGFVTKFLPSLQKSRAAIDQIKSSQNVLIETVQQENNKFVDCPALIDLEKTMSKAKLYHSKLIKLRKDMTNLHEKAKKLKKRAVKLQQQKQKEELTRAHVLEKEMEKERMLTARVATSPD
ncbi:biogenesis of lysosome-related organelles complex 1 subunit 6-like isoform X1 [Physella acuta]|uniref:biogenesis of lysosome-related organelles complex 1 subunit 6-like isoform X1 n=1 Tax=Physella acuta TaxID=109671 RepID=UPI0027DB0918|nr:biogenesis of lysosome-related organelles complex 1 subunit 6-like isoform X1 [Physella acuta]XP_059145565.1 biogenesis of lysosome-related organelles complex 1 subunit 6-like isoform X1 [Physella acuta]XP_059145566.1 biogenesis of lysosome-related organelles complex 1 subunit 6-like isoform X1 [Physella acuta]